MLVEVQVATFSGYFISSVKPTNLVSRISYYACNSKQILALSIAHMSRYHCIDLDILIKKFILLIYLVLKYLFNLLIILIYDKSIKAIMLLSSLTYLFIKSQQICIQNFFKQILRHNKVLRALTDSSTSKKNTW